MTHFSASLCVPYTERHLLTFGGSVGKCSARSPIQGGMCPLKPVTLGQESMCKSEIISGTILSNLSNLFKLIMNKIDVIVFNFDFGNVSMDVVIF